MDQFQNGGFSEDRSPTAAPPQPAKEKELQERLVKEKEKLRQRVETIDRLMGVASGILRGQERTRAPRTKKSKGTGEPGHEPEDPDGAELREIIEGARQMRALGLRAPLAAALVGAAGSSLRRWEQRLRALRGRGCRPRRVARRLTDDLL